MSVLPLTENASVLPAVELPAQLAAATEYVYSLLGVRPCVSVY